jgi:hypothetical protein
MAKETPAMLKGLMSIPKSAEVFLINTPFAWIFCVVFEPRHWYYITVEKRAGCNG